MKVLFVQKFCPHSSQREREAPSAKPLRMRICARRHCGYKRPGNGAVKLIYDSFLLTASAARPVIGQLIMNARLFKHVGGEKQHNNRAVSHFSWRKTVSSILVLVLTKLKSAKNSSPHVCTLCMYHVRRIIIIIILVFFLGDILDKHDPLRPRHSSPRIPRVRETRR